MAFLAARVGPAVVAAAALALALGRWPSGRGDGNGDGGRPVLLASAAGARFFGELSPAVRSALEPHRDYVLTGGMVGLAFPGGASAIVEGPAVFRILPGEGLGLDVGRCSVHAPGGAGGFRVETPVAEVVDRGTRFLVSVAETSETEVQVIEGAADVSGRPGAASTTTDDPRDPPRPGGRPSTAWRVRLGGRQARASSVRAPRTSARHDTPRRPIAAGCPTGLSRTRRPSAPTAARRISRASPCSGAASCAATRSTG